MSANKTFSKFYTQYLPPEAATTTGSMWFVPQTHHQPSISMNIVEYTAKPEPRFICIDDPVTRLVAERLHAFLSEYDSVTLYDNSYPNRAICLMALENNEDEQIAVIAFDTYGTVEYSAVVKAVADVDNYHFSGTDATREVAKRALGIPEDK